MEKNGFSLTDPEKSGLALTDLMHAGMGVPSPFMKDVFLLRQAIVGTRYLGGSDELVEDLQPGSRISFVAEPDNKYDRNAVMALDERGRKLGYIPRHENGILGALLRAGKNIYGIMPEGQPSSAAVAPGSEKTPFSLWVDLYMREFLLPDDLSQIPRQGHQGSYAVADFILWEEDGQISSIFAIKVINGEERDLFRREVRREDPESFREAVAAFRKFTGYLPIVSHDITEDILPQLEEAYGVQLGMPFSNHVIDTMQMAANHLPWVKMLLLTDWRMSSGLKCTAIQGKRNGVGSYGSCTAGWSARNLKKGLTAGGVPLSWNRWVPGFPSARCRIIPV